jgi:hypothetical protein
MTGSPQILFKWFKSLREATEFANNRAPNSILEIKYYDDIERKQV